LRRRRWLCRQSTRTWIIELRQKFEDRSPRKLNLSDKLVRSMLQTVVSQVANGLVLGMIYVLIALGLTIVFGLLGIVNFSHGVFFALGAHFALSLQLRFGWTVAFFLAPVLTGLVGAAVEILLVRRVYGRNPLQTLILTFALAMLIETIMRVVWGEGGQPFSTPSFLRGLIVYGPVLITKYRLAVFVITIGALGAVWALLAFTAFGRILRAGSRDPQMVELLGINLPRYLTGAFALGCILAAVAGILAAPLWNVSPAMGAAAIMPAFVVVTIGGLGSYVGAIAGGLLVGVITALAVQFAPQVSQIAMYALMIVVLLVRPRGLLGERWEQFD
jgi:branched-chain amino acid transport system permease protein